MAGKKGMHKKWLDDPKIRERVIHKIQTAGIAEMLVRYVKNGEGMDKDRASVGLGLLRKIVPDLASTELTDKREGWSDVLVRIQQAEQQVSKQPEAQAEEGAQSVH